MFVLVQTQNRNIESITDRQKEILQLLQNRAVGHPYRQNELQTALRISAPALLYHLNRLAAEHLIEKQTITQVGNARLNEITLNQAALQRVRAILGTPASQVTLITGFGVLEEGYKVPDISLRLLAAGGYKIARVVCFTSPDARQKREAHANVDHLKPCDRYCEFPYEDYRHVQSTFFEQVESILQEEQRGADVVIDLTPLSKLYSFQLLAMANQYHLPCFYLGLDAHGEYFLMWMTHLQFKGDLHKSQSTDGSIKKREGKHK